MKYTGLLTILILAISVGLKGCVSSSNGKAEVLQDPKTLQQLRVNKSTKQQVRNLLGEPQSVTVFSNETESWLYQNTHTIYTEKYFAKKAISFVPVPYLGTAVGLADSVADTSPDKRKEIDALSLIFNKKGILKQTKRETKHF